MPQVDVDNSSYMNGVKVYCWNSRIRIVVGKYCSFADGITIVAGGEHDKDWAASYPFIDRENWNEYEYIKKKRLKGDIVIGNNVWIAQNVTILSGVIIGNEALVAAGRVVVKDVLAYGIVGGVPAKQIRYRFDNNIIVKLEFIKWWDWNIGLIRKRFEEFLILLNLSKSIIEVIVGRRNELQNEDACC